MDTVRGLSFLVLGRLEAYDDGVELDVGPRKQRAVLALLLLSANHVVSTERLIDDLWGDPPPSTARATLQVYVAGLRKALGSGGASLLTRAPGYVLEVEARNPRPRSLHAATRAGARVPRHLNIELRCCTTPSGSGGTNRCPSCGPSRFRPRPSHNSNSCGSRRSRSASTPTSPSAVRPSSSRSSKPLVAEHPYRERLRAQLMLALYRSGPQADALDAYQAGRRVLQDDLGLEPGNELRGPRGRDPAAG